MYSDTRNIIDQLGGNNVTPTSAMRFVTSNFLSLGKTAEALQRNRCTYYRHKERWNESSEVPFPQSFRMGGKNVYYLPDVIIWEELLSEYKKLRHIRSVEDRKRFKYTFEQLKAAYMREQDERLKEFDMLVDTMDKRYI